MTKNPNESSCNNQRVVDHLEVVALLVDVENLEAGHVVALPGVVPVHVLVVVDGDRVRFVRRLELRVLQITHIPQVSLRVPGGYQSIITTRQRSGEGNAFSRVCL